MDADRIADAVAKHPRGIRNNNPGNIRAGQHFLGEGDPDRDGFARFDTAEHGIRAIAVDLQTKYRRGLVTVESIINVYAPPSENDTRTYVAAVCDQLGVAPYAWLHLEDGDTLFRFVAAIIRHECGPGWYTQEQIRAGVALALD